MKQKGLFIFTIVFALASLAGCGTQTNLTSEAQANGKTVQLEAGSKEQLLGVLYQSFSARNFSEQKVSEENVASIIMAGVKSPSARNSQPWHFTVVNDTSLAKNLISHTTNGTVLIVVSGLSEQLKGEGPGASFDCALATQNMFVAAQVLGLGARIYTGPRAKANEYREALKLPQGYEAVALLCIGHLANQTDAVTSASSRKQLAEVVNYVPGF